MSSVESGTMKADPVISDAVEVSGNEKSSSDSYDSYVDEKKLIRKIDLKVLPMLFLIYVAAFLDR